MGEQKSKPNQTKPTSQPISGNRHQGSIVSLYLPALYLCAYLCPSISMPVQVYKCVTTIASVYAPYPPPPY